MAAVRQAMLDRREWDALALIHGFVGFWAVAGGIGLLGGAMSQKYLDGSNFSSFTIPALALGVLVGGSSLLAAVRMWRHEDKALMTSLFASLVLAGWFVVQLAEVGLISWMQPFFIAVMVVQAALAVRLRRHTA